MGRILIIDKDTRTIEVLDLLLDVLGLSFAVASTRTNASRIYTSDQIDVIFLNPELPMMDSRAMIDEFGVVAKERNRKLPPVVFLYSNEALVRRYQLVAMPDSRLIRKPVTMEKIYGVLEELGLTELRPTVKERQMQDRLDRFADFIGQSEEWLDRLKEYLVSS